MLGWVELWLSWGFDNYSIYTDIFCMAYGSPFLILSLSVTQSVINKGGFLQIYQSLKWLYLRKTSEIFPTYLGYGPEIKARYGNIMPRYD